MKVSELPKGTNLTLVKVRLPNDILKQYIDYAGGERDMWIGGSVMGDFFMSPQPPRSEGGKAERRLYPLPPTLEPSYLLECEVIQVLEPTT